MVKHKAKYSCKGVIYFDLGAEIIKKIVISNIYFNTTEVKPADLDGGHEIVLANWTNNKHVICNYSNNIPIKLPSHPYVLINRTVHVIVE